MPPVEDQKGRFMLNSQKTERIRVSSNLPKGGAQYERREKEQRTIKASKKQRSDREGGIQSSVRRRLCEKERESESKLAEKKEFVIFHIERLTYRQPPFGVGSRFPSLHCSRPHL